MSIHKRIKAARIAKGLSMEALAKAVGVKSWQTIQQWEKDTAPKRTRINAVCSALGVSAEYLLNGSVSKGSTVLALKDHQTPQYVHPDKDIAQAVALLEATDERGRVMALGAIRSVLNGYTPAKENHAG